MLFFGVYFSMMILDRFYNSCQPILATAGLLPAIPATLAAADQVVLLQLPVLLVPTGGRRREETLK